MSKEKKNRFYYSKKQNEIDEEMWNMPTRFTFVKTPDGWKQYSEWCSVKGAKCNWEDAELVYETDDEPEIIIHECIPELIADLEAKLAEKEKEFNWLHEKFAKYREYRHQEKISFAVERLEKVKKLFEEKYSYDVEESDFAVIYEIDIDEIIDNQIRQLKEGK